MSNKIKEITELFKQIQGISSKTAERLAINLVENPEISDNMAKIIEISSELTVDPLTNLIISKGFEANSNKNKDILLVFDTNKEAANYESKTLSPDSMFITNIENKKDFNNTKDVLNRLFDVIKRYNTKELIFLLTPSIESELLMRVIKEEMNNIELDKKPKLSRISMGIPFGGSIEYTDQRTIKEAMKKREEA